MSIVIGWVTLSLVFSLVFGVHLARAYAIDKDVRFDRTSTRLERKMARANVWLYGGLTVAGLAHLEAGVAAIIFRLLEVAPENELRTLLVIGGLIAGEAFLLLAGLKRAFDLWR